MRRYLTLFLFFAALAVPTPAWEASTSANLTIAVAASQAISAIALSNNAVAGGAPSGTVVGAISVTMSPASPAFSGTLSLGGANASSFKIAGANLETNGVLPAGTYQVNIVATQPGATGSPFTASNTVTGTSATASSCPHGNAYADGCPGAPAGTPQYPGLLTKYGANRPPWNVAGVDYYVGAPAGQPLKDWRTLQAASGWEWNASGNYLRCNSGNQVLDGYDFTTGATSWSIYVPSGGCTGLTVTNSKLGCMTGASGQNAPGFGGFNMQVATMNFVFKNNTVDFVNCQGAGAANGPYGLVGLGPVGCASCSADLEYNYFRDLYNTLGNFGGTYTSFIYRYNVMENPATSQPGDPDKIHMNSLGWAGGGTVSPTYTFNTTFASQSYAGGEFPQFYYNSGGTFNSPTVTNNTFPLSACNCVSYMVHGNTGYSGGATNVTGSPIASQNYFDTTNSYGAFYSGSFTGWSVSGNVNMVTGAAITP